VESADGSLIYVNEVEQEDKAACFRCRPNDWARAWLLKEAQDTARQVSIGQKITQLESLRSQLSNAPIQFKIMQDELERLRQAFVTASAERNGLANEWRMIQDGLREHCRSKAIRRDTPTAERCRHLLDDLERIKQLGLKTRQERDELDTEVKSLTRTIQVQFPKETRLLEEIDENEVEIQRMEVEA
jgi:predicted  nucleic acid-binding Zn-ribbon protein